METGEEHQASPLPVGARPNRARRLTGNMPKFYTPLSSVQAQTKSPVPARSIHGLVLMFRGATFAF